MISRETELIMATSPPSTPAGVPIAGAPAPAVGGKGRRYRQRPLGPAPFASFEDLSDELDSPPETARVPLPGIKEDPASQIQTPSTPHTLVMGISLTEKEDQGLKEALSGSLDTPAPPRIDISRASSSSQHEDSITSSPDREGGPQTLGYKEDGTVDLRSSTEELDYIQEPGTVEESEAKRKREKMMKKQQQLKQDFCDVQSEIDFKERKDSSCSVMSDVGLLCISGRTSRLSSIGSAASGGSVASGASHLSAGSHLSGRSTRSPSPHKMLLETSFCGSKPMQTQSIEAEAAPALVSHMEKQSSRPPSRLCSRSPSPHKMLLETSFCGTKQILPPAESEGKVEVSSEKFKKKKASLTPQAVPTATAPQKVQKAEAKHSLDANKENLTAQRVKKTEEVKKEAEVLVPEIVPKPKKAKPVSLPRLPDRKTNYSRPKKIISIRDIPADEIYIPLKGPEVDLEEIIRKASPNLKRKDKQVEKHSEKQSEDVIFISLHSPTGSEKEKERESETEKQIDAATPFKQNFDEGIYIPLHSPPKSPKPDPSRTPQKVLRPLETPVKKTVHKEVRKTKYEVCEDGSIIIPLHSPDEDDKPVRTFEDEIRRVNEELQKARELAEKRLQEEDKKLKPSTLDLSDHGEARQSLPQSRPELTSGGSRTPSPGSSLSRKSSFASIFRRSDVTGSPDSSGSSLVRKKSGTFSKIIKETGDGLRDRSRSRSKNRERQSQSAVSRSPSIKKNVFTNLFGKKKGDEKANYGKADDDDKSQTAARLNQHVSYSAERKSSGDEGDYIIIPLRDPSDPTPRLDDELQDESEKATQDTLPSPVVVLERFDSPRSSRRSKERDEHKEEIDRTGSKTPAKASPDEGTERLRLEIPFTSEAVSEVSKSVETTQETVTVTANIEEMTTLREKSALSESSLSLERKSVEKASGKSRPRKSSPKSDEEEIKKMDESGNLETDAGETGNKADLTLEHNSSLDMEEGAVKEEMMAVSTGGIRTLKLPPEPGDLGDDHERKGLVLQESFDDELPYVPTTLPLERSVGVPIVPVKHRVTEIKTCPIERPRSTTPINPSTLEDYVNVKEPVKVSAEEKMKISLPRDDSISGKAKSPRRFSAKGKSWFEFAEAVSQPREPRKSSLTTTPSPPPLPPRSSPPVALSTSAPQATSSWINFEELPEKRKQPKRITTVPPLRSSTDGGVVSEKPSASAGGSVIYSYVSPEDCQCECHDHNAHGSGSHPKESKSNRAQGDIVETSVKKECEDCDSGRHEEADEEDMEKKPLLECNSDGENEDSTSRKDGDWELAIPGRKRDVDRQSLLSDSSYECTNQDGGSLGELDNGGGDKPEMKPFEMDFDVKSNRSSLISQDDPGSPEVSSSLPL